MKVDNTVNTQIDAALISSDELFEIAQLISVDELVVPSENSGEEISYDSPWDASVEVDGSSESVEGNISSGPFGDDALFDSDAFMQHLDAATSFFFEKGTFVRTKATLTENSEYDELVNDVVKGAGDVNLSVNFKVSTPAEGFLTTLAEPSDSVQVDYDEEYGTYAISGDKASVEDYMSNMLFISKDRIQTSVEINVETSSGLGGEMLDERTITLNNLWDTASNRDANMSLDDSTLNISGGGISQFAQAQRIDTDGRVNRDSNDFDDNENRIDQSGGGNSDDNEENDGDFVPGAGVEAEAEAENNGPSSTAIGGQIARAGADNSFSVASHFLIVMVTR